MKKLFILFFCVALVVSCASNNVTSEGGFVTTYDEVTGVTETIHEDLQPGMIYNVRDNITGEREHVLLAIQNDKILLGVLYQYNRWAFLDSVVFIADGKRLEIKLDNRQTSIIKGNVVREGYSVALSADEVAALRELLASEACGVAFLGSNYRTDKIMLKDKTRAALLATVERLAL